MRSPISSHEIVVLLIEWPQHCLKAPRVTERTSVWWGSHAHGLTGKLYSDTGTMKGSGQMHFGVSMFHTDYSIPAVELARALEARGFESMWAPEHSHIPVPRRTQFPGGGELPKPYYEVMDPFVVLAAAAAVTKTLRLATGVCLVVQRDPIQTAKLV